VAGIRKVDHVAIVLESIAPAIPLFRDALGGRFISGGDNDETGIRLVHLKYPGFKLELMAPLRPNTFLQPHLDRRGPGFHHLTFFVDDLVTTVGGLEAAGIRMTGTDVSASAWKESFIHPKSGFGALFQLVEATRDWDEPAAGITLDDVLAGRVAWRDYIPCLRAEGNPG
jgi:methylmalonyl-CoA/ethylmalonyl-CoA epimerase